MNFTKTIKAANGSIENLNITYKTTSVSSIKGYELYINGQRSYIVLTKYDSSWIAYSLNKCDLQLRKATEYIAADTLKEAKDVILRMLNIQLKAQDWYNTAAEQKDPKAKHLAIIVGDSVLEYNAPQKHCIDAFNNRITELEATKDLKQKSKTMKTAGNIIFNKGLEDVTKLANMYTAQALGFIRTAPTKVTSVDKTTAVQIASAYESMNDNYTTSKETRKCYDALVKETLMQYRYFLAAGYTITINNTEAYGSSAEMIADLRENKTIKIFSTESGFGSDGITSEMRSKNPLLSPTEFKDTTGQLLLVNDIFRAVHDFFGHAELGNGFGAIGEENAWRCHATMFTATALRALTTETKGQNCWVNFSGVNDTKEIKELRTQARALRTAGKTAEAQVLVDKIYSLFKFADQKNGLLPAEYCKL